MRPPSLCIYAPLLGTNRKTEAHFPLGVGESDRDTIGRDGISRARRLRRHAMGGQEPAETADGQEEFLVGDAGLLNPSHLLELDDPVILAEDDFGEPDVEMHAELDQSRYRGQVYRDS